MSKCVLLKATLTTCLYQSCQYTTLYLIFYADYKKNLKYQCPGYLCHFFYLVHSGKMSLKSEVVGRMYSQYNILIFTYALLNRLHLASCLSPNYGDMISILQHMHTYVPKIPRRLILMAWRFSTKTTRCLPPFWGMISSLLLVSGVAN